MKSFKLLIGALLIMMLACDKVDLYEKSVAIPKHSWKSDFKPSVEFEIADTNSLYHVFVVIRHSDAYRYKNLWLNLISQPPGSKADTVRMNLVLGNDEKGWLGKGMDDIYEHRILFNTEGLRFLRAGHHKFTLQQIMRDDPLDHVFNAGIRLEKIAK